MTLVTLGLASLVFVIGFTVYACRSSDGQAGRAGRQTSRQAILESWVNILAGFSVNFFLNLLMLPMLGITLSAGDNFYLGCVYTAVSVVRSFVIRRYAESYIHRFAARAAERIS
jgi:hypothetical protein